ncbi:hypothetical protein CISIN_1g035146mg [Citrus sinensis]|uniref:Uncharacterized protein n=1 Tax=Citrus sinensis TaxID=2711 RepID=A0A067FE48_CITSI|nr:hypothetical protein CISIN_1g035146mg [Citrus sinensis]
MPIIQKDKKRGLAKNGSEKGLWNCGFARKRSRRELRNKCKPVMIAYKHKLNSAENIGDSWIKLKFLDGPIKQ